MYNVGQADNLLSAGKVQYPNYPMRDTDNYSCVYTPPDNSKPPKSIPLGAYDDFNNNSLYTVREPYVNDTQQKRAGELSDQSILFIMIVLFVALCVCTFLSFQH